MAKKYAKGEWDHHETGSCIYKHGCTRPECRENRRAYGRRAEKERRLGHKKLISGELVKKRIQQDLDAGYTRAQLERMIFGPDSKAKINSIMNWRREKVNRSFAKPIFETPRTEQPLGMIPALKTRRQLRALQADGWPFKDIEAMLQEKGLTVNQRWLTNITTDKVARVRAYNAAGIDDLFEKLVLTPGPSDNVRASAKAKGWARPLAWDPDTMHLPDAEPDGHYKEDKKGRCLDCLVRVVSQKKYNETGEWTRRQMRVFHEDFDGNRRCAICHAKHERRQLSVW